MKTFFKYLILVNGLSLSCTSYGQRTVEPVKGYDRILSIRFGKTESWNSIKEKTLNSLVDVVLNQGKNYNQILPLQCIKGKDTVICFFFSKDLRKLHKKLPVKFTGNSDFERKPFASILKKKIEPKFTYDSVFNVMKNNMLVNSKEFNLDKFLDSNETNAICCQPKTQEERLYLIYVFFKNGILLGEEGYTGRLYYKPY